MIMSVYKHEPEKKNLKYQHKNKWKPHKEETTANKKASKQDEQREREEGETNADSYMEGERERG